MNSKNINLVECLNQAWTLRTKTKPEDYSNKFINLLIPAYSKLYELITKQCEIQKVQYNDEVFNCFCYLLIKIMMADDEFLQGEYDELNAFCDECGYNKVSQDDVKEVIKSFNDNPDLFDSIISVIKSSRKSFDNDEYLQLIIGLCFYSLSGDKELDEEEYNLIIKLLDENVDIYPTNIEELQKVWK